MKTDTLKARFMRDDAARQENLEDACLCTALSKAWLLPPPGHSKNDDLPENFQSLGSRGLTNMEGIFLNALYPIDYPYFQLTLPPDVLYNPEIPDDSKQALIDAYYAWSLQVQATLETQNRLDQRRPNVGFRSSKRAAIAQLLGTGDSLEWLEWNEGGFKNHVFRRDQYVTKRDTSLNVLYHTIKEQVDPKALSEDQQRKAAFTDEQMGEEDPSRRLVDLFTHVEWQPATNRWTITQETNDRIIGERDETIPSYMSTAFELVAGEDYGRGLIAANRGDLSSLNNLRRRMLDAAAVLSDMKLFLDVSSLIRDEDLEKPSGSVIRGANVKQGQLQDVAFGASGKIGEMSWVANLANTIEASLGKAMLLQSEAVRKSERTTAYEVANVTLRELEGATGGMYTPIAEQQQAPLIRRAIHVMQEKKLLPAIDARDARFELLTGLAALQREARQQNILSFAEVLSKLGDEGLRYLNTGVFVQVMARYQNLLAEPGLVRTDSEVQERAQQQEEALARQTATAQAIESTGRIAEQQAAASQGGA